MPNEVQINELNKKMGQITLKWGIDKLQECYKNIPRKKVSYGALNTLFTLVRPKITVDQRDLEFYLTDWNVWSNFLEVVLPDKIDYFPDRFDCDNYAFWTSALASRTMLVNSCGVAHCTTYDKYTDKVVAGHYINLIAANDGVYAFDLNMKSYSKGCGWVKVEKDIDPIIGPWKYKDIYKVTCF